MLGRWVLGFHLIALLGMGQAFAMEPSCGPYATSSSASSAPPSSPPPPEWEVKERLSSPDNKITLTRYSLNQAADPNKWYTPGCIHVSGPSQSWWVPQKSNAVVAIGEFVNNTNVLLYVNSITSVSTTLLNLNTKHWTALGGGRGTYITKDNDATGQNEGLVLLTSAKRYFPGGGAYWIDLLVDIDGNLIEFVSADHGKCHAIRDLLLPSEATTKLRQPLEQCVRVKN